MTTESNNFFQLPGFPIDSSSHPPKYHLITWKAVTGHNFIIPFTKNKITNLTASILFQY